MQIHNFFSDALLSIRTLLDNIIFRQHTIKSYQFNISNRTFTLLQNDYKPNYNLPACIVTLNNEEYSFGERPTVIQRTPISNINQIRTLYDPVSQWSIFVQEEHVRLNMSVQINCESQLQAKELEFMIKRCLPYNKYILLFEFAAFLEISPQTLLSLGMDFNNNQITNLFTRLDKKLGQMVYCFPIFYNPLIFLQSSNVSIQDKQMNTFPVNLEIMYQIQMPMWVCGDKEPSRIDTIDILFGSIGTSPIISRVKLLKDNVLYSKDSTIVRKLLIHDLHDFNLRQITNDIDSPYIFELQFPHDDLILTNKQFSIFTTYGRLRKIIPISIDLELNQAKFKISKKEYNHEFKTDLTNPIVLLIHEDTIPIIEEEPKEKYKTIVNTQPGLWFP